MYNSEVIYCKVVLIPLVYDRDLVPDSPFIMLPNEATSYRNVHEKDALKPSSQIF